MAAWHQQRQTRLQAAVAADLDELIHLIAQAARVRQARTRRAHRPGPVDAYGGKRARRPGAVSPARSCDRRTWAARAGPATHATKTRPSPANQSRTLPHDQRSSPLSCAIVIRRRAPKIIYASGTV
jgi:hypothetical protein